MPPAWKLAPLGSVVSVVSGATPSKDHPEFWSGTIPWVSPKDMKVPVIADSEDHVSDDALAASPLKIVEPPAVLLVIRGMILAHTVPVALTAAPVTLNQDMKALRPRAGIHARFLAYQLRALGPALLSMIEEAGHGTRCLRTDLWRKLMVAVPPEAEQFSIADFLDRKTAAVDALIDKEEQMLTLLAEKRRALVAQSVTKGLDPTAAMKDSGVEWLNDIPTGWEVRRSKRLFQQRKQRANIEDEQLTASQAYGVIPQREYTARTGQRVVQLTTNWELRKRVERDDFVISMRSFEGGLERAWAAGGIRSSYVVLKPSNAVDVGYYTHLFKCSSYIGALQRTALFIRDGQDLTFDNFVLVDLPLPPKEEQRRIAEFLDAQVSEIDELSDKTRDVVAKLREYRQALITAAVTGQLDLAAQEAA